MLLTNTATTSWPRSLRVSKSSAAEELMRRRMARRNLIDFATYTDPTFQHARHIEFIARRLEAAGRREIKRLMLFGPPRHGKSRIASELFPAWMLGKDPTEQFMIASHTAALAETFSRNVRNAIADDRYQHLFGNTALSEDSATIQKWTLEDQVRPAMLTVGVGGSPVGQGAKILIIDDPFGSQEQAESEIYRKGLYEWYTETIYPRLEPDAVIILMMQRWHEDDLAGRLLRDQSRADKWEIVAMPAIADNQADRDEMNKRYYLPIGLADPLDRQAGEPLWPERWSIDALSTIKAVSVRSFEAKYQQRPRPAEGAKFKRGWLRVIDAASVPPNLQWMRYWDLAYGQKQHNDNTATISGAFDADGTIYLRRGRAGKMESPDARKTIKEFMQLEPDVEHGIENKVHGGPVVQDLLRDQALVNFSFRPVEVHGDKVVRATPVADRSEAGKLAFARADVNDDVWINEWIEEMCAFPYGTHDDRVDAVSGVFAMLAAGLNKMEEGKSPLSGYRG